LHAEVVVGVVVVGGAQMPQAMGHLDRSSTKYDSEYSGVPSASHGKPYSSPQSEHPKPAAALPKGIPSVHALSSSQIGVVVPVVVPVVVDDIV
jgi:hypothetical protein